MRRPLAPCACLAACLAAWLSGCSLHREPGVYPLDASAASARLAHADIDAFSEARGCGIPLSIARENLRDGKSIWTVSADGGEIARFAVTLEPIDAGQTRVAIDLPASTMDQPLVTTSGKPALRQPLQGAAVELIDAALNNRAFDPGRIGDARPAGEACGAQSAPVSVATNPGNPWSSAPPASEPHTADTPVGPPMLQTNAAGHEDRLEDLPRPGG